MALSEIYVDPSIAADSGTGTIGDPFGDLEYAIEQTTFDTTNGTRVNIKAGTAEVLAASLDNALNNAVTTPAWAPSEAAPCIFQGYTSVAADGGLGSISGGGSVSVFAGAAFDWIKFVDLELHNTGANNIIDVDNDCTFIRCKVHNTTASAILADVSTIVRGCYVYNFGVYGIDPLNGSQLENNYVDTAGGGGSYGMRLGFSCIARNNIIVNDTISGVGILTSEDCLIDRNSLYSSVAGVNSGIEVSTAQPPYSITNNLIEGWSGTGGFGIEFTSGTSKFIQTYGGNAVYNCTTAYDTTDHVIDDLGDNETLSASPFTDAANGDFSPVDTGNVREGSLPNVIGGGLV